MNTLQATVISIKRLEQLHYLQCRVGMQHIAMLSLQVDAALVVGSQVCLGVKSTDIMIATMHDLPLSITNRLQARITKIDNGTLLSSIILDIEGTVLQSIMTLGAAQALALSVGDRVTVLIKESDVSLC